MRTIRNVALAALLALALPAVADDLAERVDAYLAPAMEDGLVSATLLIARGDSVVYENAWGMASHELGVRNEVDTVYGIASVAKPVTIAIVCVLADEGLLLPTDALAKWIPEFPRGDEITVSHLLNHRGGIPHRVMDDELEFVPHTAAEMVEFAIERLAERSDELPEGPAAGLLCEPGEESIYSSGGFAVLARVCELASGQSYEDLVETRICEPLGITTHRCTPHRDA